jgi:Xaa-Pro aminopeptidase
MNQNALLLSAEGVEQVQSELRQMGLEGWLLYEFHGQNAISQKLIGLEWTTRRGFVLIPADGTPRAMIHAIEGSSWREWPWERLRYSGWREMEERLAELIGDRTRLAMEVSPRSAVPYVDQVPSGIVDLIRSMGVEPVSSGDLVSAFHSRWSEEQLTEHRQSAVIVQETAAAAFQLAADAIRSGTPTTESAVGDWIRGELNRRGLTDEVDCIVAIGPRAADPHYAPVDPGETINRGDLLLIDLWGAPSPEACPADQTWMGFMGSEADARTVEIWEAVRDARDAGVTFLEERHRAGAEVRGFEVDDVVRKVIEDRGYGEYFVHRTGHSIDRGLHGSGPNLDNLETRDDRLLIQGVGFSIEPGIYITDDIGVRSELNIHMGPDGPEVTTPKLQDQLFFLLDD